MAQGHVQHGSVFRDVDLVTTEHGVDAGSQSGFVGQLNEQTKCFVSHSVLGVIEKDARGLGSEPFPACGVVGKEAAEMDVAHQNAVRFQSFPRGAITQCGCAHNEFPHATIDIPDFRFGTSELRMHEFQRSIDHVNASVTICWASATIASKWPWSQKLSA